MIKQFKLTIMNSNGIRFHYENCANIESAIIITQAIYKDYRVIEVEEVV